MAVAYQTGVATNSAANVATLTSASMTVSGSNTYLLALVVSGAGSPVDPVSCKWGGSGGTAMTKVGATLTFGPYWKASLYELVAPAAGANTLYVDYGTNQDETGVIGVLYTGVDQTTPRGTVGTGSNSNSHPQSATCTTVAGDIVVSAIFVGRDLSGFTDSQTVRQSWASIVSGYELASVGDKTASGTSRIDDLKEKQRATRMPQRFGIGDDLFGLLGTIERHDDEFMFGLLGHRWAVLSRDEG